MENKNRKCKKKNNEHGARQQNFMSKVKIHESNKILLQKNPKFFLLVLTLLHVKFLIKIILNKLSQKAQLSNKILSQSHAQKQILKCSFKFLRLHSDNITLSS